MGNSASCFDPVREHPPYSWPKDHPGRDAAIAERKRSRRSKRRSAATAQPVDKEPATDLTSTTQDTEPKQSTPVTLDNKPDITSVIPPVTKQSPLESNLVKDLELEKDTILDKPKSPQVATKEIPITPVVNETPEIVKNSVNQPIESENVLDEIKQNHDQLPVETEPVVVVDEEADNLLDDDEKIDEVDDIQIEETEIEKVQEKEEFIDAATTDPITPMKDLSEEEIKPVDLIEETPVETEVIDPVEDIKKDITDTTATTNVVTEEKDINETDDPDGTAFDTTRAMFDNTKDDLPEVGDLNRDVFDPVMKEYITLPEYRKRQAERAQGVVKERVEKFEEIDDQVSKQKAEMQAIDAVRVEMAEKAEWRFKTNSSQNDVEDYAKPTVGATTVLDNVTEEEDEEDEIDEAVVIEGIPSLTDLDGSANDSVITKEVNKTTVVEPAILPTS